MSTENLFDRIPQWLKSLHELALPATFTGFSIPSFFTISPEQTTTAPAPSAMPQHCCRVMG